MSMQENIHVCVVLNRVHFLNKYSQNNMRLKKSPQDCRGL